MPNKDKTGPQGLGPMTGRGLGICKNKNIKETKSKIGETKFVKEQYEEGVAQKLKGANKTSLFVVHGRGK